MDIRLDGKHAMVCGSTQGIGRATAELLARQGASVTLLARNAEKLKSVCNGLDSSAGQSHSYLIADFTKPSELKSVLEAYIAKAEPISILINNTGGPQGGPVFNADVEEFRVAFNNHLICNHILAQALVPGMKSLGYGRIVNVISTSVKVPLNNLGVSNTVRGAVANWSKTLANELAQFNITVNNVLPGATNTERLTNLVKVNAEKQGVREQDILDKMVAAIPMKRVCEPEETANAIAFLASPAASYITGINVPVDGGRTPSL